MSRLIFIFIALVLSISVSAAEAENIAPTLCSSNPSVLEAREELENILLELKEKVDDSVVSAHLNLVKGAISNLAESSDNICGDLALIYKESAQMSVGLLDTVKQYTGEDSP